MDLSKIVYGFLIILALTLNFSFFLGDSDNKEHHHFLLLIAAASINIICVYYIYHDSLIAKDHDRSKGKEILFGSGLVAALLLLLAIVVWVFGADFEPTGQLLFKIHSLSGGALLANFVTTCFFVLETLFYVNNGSK